MISEGSGSTLTVLVQIAHNECEVVQRAYLVPNRVGVVLDDLRLLLRPCRKRRNIV